MDIDHSGLLVCVRQDNLISGPIMISFALIVIPACFKRGIQADPKPAPRQKHSGWHIGLHCITIASPICFDRFERFEIDGELKFDRLLEGNMSWFDAVEKLST